MPIQAGTYRLGPHNATLSVHTKRSGAAAKAGHDLEIHVTSWQGTLELATAGGDTRMELAADAASLRVQQGTGGMKPLGDDDRANIHQTIDDEVLERQDIAFRSTSVQSAHGSMHVRGDLTLAGTTRPIEFDLVIGEDRTLRAAATVEQSLWGMKPYSALFGALKVADEVEVALDARL